MSSQVTTTRVNSLGLVNQARAKLIKPPELAQESYIGTSTFHLSGLPVLEWVNLFKLLARVQFHSGGTNSPQAVARRPVERVADRVSRSLVSQAVSRILL